jgi:hypothetical protein
METTKNSLSPPIRLFFHRLSERLRLKPHFYGSVQRNDFISGKSDIDVCYFTDDETSIARWLSADLNQSFANIQKVVWDIRGTMVTGYKIKYKDIGIGLDAEIAIYGEKYKDLVLKELKQRFYLPWFVQFPMMLTKFLYYTLGLMPKSTYNTIKHTLLSYGTGDGKPAPFLVWKEHNIV